MYTHCPELGDATLLGELQQKPQCSVAKPP
jgi:hypothetical protein